MYHPACWKPRLEISSRLSKILYCSVLPLSSGTFSLYHAMLKFCALQVRFKTEPASWYTMEPCCEVMVGGSANAGVGHKTNHCLVLTMQNLSRQPYTQALSLM